MKRTKNTASLFSLLYSSVFAALICTATMFLKIPIPMGYLHLGDSLVLLAGFLADPFYGFLAAAVGSAFADLFLGYFPYVPITFFIKGIVALTVHGMVIGMLPIFKKHSAFIYLVSGMIGEVMMVIGYYLFEAFLLGYGYMTALVGIVPNILQGLIGVFIGTVLMMMLQKNKLMTVFSKINHRKGSDTNV